MTEKQSRLGQLERLGGPTSDKVVRARERYEDADRAYRTLQLKLNRPVRTQLTHVYWPILAILLLLEAPINRLAFELFFQETALISWLLAGAVGALLLGLAHFISPAQEEQ